ncbi:MAG TPA: glycosyltransferase family 87 protein [Candidatus Limnocylindria bacterium]|nr:glycosyltransferase family 87 protein [Candidatus Limnocylindria bacterium]
MSTTRRADLAYFTAIAFGLLFVILGGPLGRRLEMVHFNDFSGVWSGPSAYLAGVSPWDHARFVDTAIALGAKTPDSLVWDYMPWVLFGMLPFALVPIEVAGWIWMLVSMSAATFALRALLRAYLPGDPAAHFALGLALFVGQPGFHAVVLGQWSPVLMSAVAATVLALRAGRPSLAAVPSLLFLAKPQLFVFTALGLAYGALRRPSHRRYVVMAGVLGLAVVAASWLAVGDWLTPWLADIPGRRTLRSAVLPSALNELVGPAGRIVAAVLILAGAAVASRFPPGSDASLAAWISLSSAGAIYSWSYDQLLLFVPITITAGILSRTSPLAARRFVIAWALVFVAVSPVLYAIGVARHDETFSCVVPDAAFVTIVALLWRRRGAPDAAARAAAANAVVAPAA